MKTVANLGTVQEAQLLKLRLGSMGVEAFIPDEVSAGMAPHFFGNRPGVRLQVADCDEEEAKRILEEGFDEEEPDSEESESAD